MWDSNTSRFKQSFVIPGIGHVDFMDNALTDPFWTSMINGDGKLKRNGNDVYLVNTAIWMRFIANIDSVQNPDTAPFCDMDGPAD